MEKDKLADYHSSVKVSHMCLEGATVKIITEETETDQPFPAYSRLCTHVQQMAAKLFIVTHFLFFHKGFNYIFFPFM